MALIGRDDAIHRSSVKDVSVRASAIVLPLPSPLCPWGGCHRCRGHHELLGEGWACVCCKWPCQQASQHIWAQGFPSTFHNFLTKPRKEVMETEMCPAAAHRDQGEGWCVPGLSTDLNYFSWIDTHPRFWHFNELASDSLSPLPHTKFRSRQILEAIGYLAW